MALHHDHANRDIGADLCVEAHMTGVVKQFHGLPGDNTPGCGFVWMQMHPWPTLTAT
jgi:hypothetical protein